MHAHTLSLEENYDYHDIWGVHNATGLCIHIESDSQQEKSEQDTGQLAYRLN